MNKKQVMISGLAALVIPLSILVSTITKSDNPTGSANVEAARILEVSVISRSSASDRALFEAYGEARARYDITLSSEVSGRILKVHSAAESGSHVSAGDLLMQIEDSDYQLAVKAAKRVIVDAEVTLLQEERRRKQAQKEWDSTAFDSPPLSDLVLRKPQLAAAKALVEEAQASLTVARKNCNTPMFECHLMPWSSNVTFPQEAPS